MTTFKTSERKHAKTPRKASTTTRQRQKRSPTEPSLRSYLGPELGGSGNPEEGGTGVALQQLVHDPNLLQMGLDLWRDLQGTTGAGGADPAEADQLFKNLWTHDPNEFVTTSSTRAELIRYRRKLEFRAKLLEGLLEETIGELETLTHFKASDDRDDTDPGDE
jgi:hypothetical protein